MPNTGTVRQKKSPATPTVISITDGTPHPSLVKVRTDATLQFANKDDKDYRLRLWTRENERRPDISILLPASGSVTFMGDLETAKKGECEYQLFATDLARPKHASGGRPPGGP